MKTLRITLVCIHTIAVIFALINLHPLLSDKNHENKLSTFIGYSNGLIRISLYHIACIIAIWSSRRYGASTIRATGILLITELIQVITLVIQDALETKDIGHGEIASNVTHFILLLVALMMTFKLAHKISNRENNSMQIELLADTANNAIMDHDIGPDCL
jgi:hypothetical protein